MDSETMRQDWTRLTDLMAQFVTGFMAESEGAPQDLSPAERMGLDRAVLKAIESSAQSILAYRSGSPHRRSFNGTEVEVAELLDYDGTGWSWRYRIGHAGRWARAAYQTRDEALCAARDVIIGEGYGV